ncbi:ABC transporter ATP-binding protein [Ammoniphilus resinae]|uniref:ABC-2 type transport system ATP-binding protein n=1 Tax=Ammoniphilus resinae TaxID=861532 RepID=A0ABS4GM92_9BACL|nr:ABC transporter ATP-binding protein [Ammoniphilus resinae]MBP1931192.1 ABC-2 type transport system ATP-binding protein [Ammoniphilus resinae]
MGHPVLQVQEITGGYMKGKPVLHRVSIDIQSHEMVGLIGLNGAGKSTTIKHILGLLDPFEGTILLGGMKRKDSPAEYASRMSYIPETPLFYEHLTLWEHLELTAMAYQLNQSDFEKRAKELLQEFRMERMVNWFPSTFSKGMKQKLMIINAFLTDPALYIVDEPFVGLDPRGIQSLLQMLEKKKREGASILMSTHILATAEQYCDRLILLHEGRVVLRGTLADLRQQTGMERASLEDIFLTVTEVQRNG